jgi:hypothetical protein
MRTKWICARCGAGHVWINVSTEPPTDPTGAEACGYVESIP